MAAMRQEAGKMTMELTNIKQLFRDREQYIGQKVTVGGWVRSNRDSKNFGFLVVNDGTFFEPLQVVYAAELWGYRQDRSGERGDRHGNYRGDARR